MGIGLTKVKHVKLPVSDLQRSVSWYQSLLLLDLELRTEFVEDGSSAAHRHSTATATAATRSPCATRTSVPARSTHRASTCSR